MEYTHALESILFYKAEPVSYETLCSVLHCSEEELKEALVSLSDQLTDRGVRLVADGHTAELVTAPEAAPYISALTTNELTKRLGKAGLETLTIILYQAPVTRRDIDYIRGVNSSQIIRNLLIRGLIQKNEEGNTMTRYEPTTDLLKYLGITAPEELPDYEDTRTEIRTYYERSH